MPVRFESFFCTLAGVWGPAGVAGVFGVGAAGVPGRNETFSVLDLSILMGVSEDFNDDIVPSVFRALRGVPGVESVPNVWLCKERNTYW